MQQATYYPEISIYLNGFHVLQNEIEGLMVSECNGFAYIDGIAAEKYDITWGKDPVSKKSAPAVLITTRFPVRNAPNVTADRPLGWQRPARFYTPKYESDASKKAFEPMRATLHWEPSLRFENGEARFEFWTSDHQAPCRIILEGVADSKRFISNSIVY